MRILAIETSCDDTGVAILEVSQAGNFNILSNIVSSQIEVHKKYGGVYPMMAKREHQKNLVPTFMRALKQAKLLNPKSKIQISKQIQNPNFKKILNTKYKILNTILEREPELLKKIIPFLQKYGKPDVDLISVTNGPGLEPCLWVGVNFAKTLAYFWNIPIIPVNHIESHILVNTLERPKGCLDIKFPAISLVVSGGHTQLILIHPHTKRGSLGKNKIDDESARYGVGVNGIGKYKILGETRDDAAGECFDKCAKILNLGYPGGPIISKLAEKIETKKTLPRPMIGTKDYDFSFSGLKTAVLYADRKIKNKTKKYKKEMSAEVQQAVIDVLLKKTIKAVKDYDAKTLILGGGVTANKKLRIQFEAKLKKEKPDAKFLVPPPNLSTDNGLMTAVAGYFRAKQKKITEWQDLKADANLRIQ